MKPINKPRRYMMSAIALVAALAVSPRADAGELITTRTYDTSTITLTTTTAPDGTPYQKIEWPGLHNLAEIGEPELPIEYFRFLVPVYSGNFTATAISYGSALTLPLTSRIYPGQIPQKTDGSPVPEFVHPLESAYSVPAEVEAWVESDGFIDGCNHMVTVAVRPVRYDDSVLHANAYGNITVKLTYEECSESELIGSKPIFPPKASRYFNLDELCVNAIDVPRFVPQRSNQAAGQTSDASQGDIDRYYIIVPANLESAVEELAVWKRQKGYAVVVKTIEDILSTPKYAVNATAELVDEAASLREYLRDEYAQNGAYFCLLVGNSKTSMPIRKLIHHNSYYDNKLDNGSSVVPTDAYFSDFTQVYNLTQECDGGMYTCHYSKVRYHPDIYIGRLLCSEPKEIDNYLEKLIIYESNPGLGNSMYLQEAMIFAANPQFISEYQDIYPILYEIFSLKSLVDTGNSTYPKGSDVIESMNSVGFSSWHGHGSPYGVTCSEQSESTIDGETIRFQSRNITSLDKIMNRDASDDEIKTYSWFVNENGNGLDNMTNYHRPGIVYSISCDNNPFDQLISLSSAFPDGRWSFDRCYNLGESYTIGSNTGGVAFLGYSREGYVGVSEELEESFINYLKYFRKIGISEALSKIQYNDTYLSIAHHLIGDPEFEMWLGKPKSYTATPIITNTSISFEEELPDSTKVVIYDGLGNSEAFFTTSSSARSIIGGGIPFPEQKYIYDMAISTWKTGYLPTITYYGRGIGLTNMSKSYIVRDAFIGYALRPFTVGENASLKVKAIDSINSAGALEIKAGGDVNFECSQSINLDKCTIESGAKMSIEGKMIKLGAGFKVEKGGILKIQNKK